MELISRKELRDKMFHEAFETDSDMQKWESGCWIRYKLFKKILDDMPIIESRPKGKWIDKHAAYYECSNCEEWVNKSDAHKYCTYCGADMRGEE